MTVGTVTAGTVAPRLRLALLGVSGMTPDLLDGDAPEEYDGALDEELQLVDDLDFDSVMLLELKCQLEQRFPELGELSMPEILPELRTVGSILGLLTRRLAAVGAV
ncbi:acyl carrier protein [Streptomyces sp. NPDC057027]|uniref:acyl carrier protein n=1 Tax=unclassified Streptomyces TaxID=2593676 RepID=UPI00363CF30B